MTADVVDRTRPVRAGEELDLARLEPWLLAEVADLRAPLRVEQFPGGHSNLTYLVADAAGRELVLRRPPFGAAIKTAHDMGREFRILSGLYRAYPKVPRPLAYDADGEVLGAPFYVMERVRGVILRGSAPPKGLELGPELMRRLSGALVDNLAAIHAVDPAAAGLADLGRPEGYVERQVRGWAERWRAARTDDVADVERAIAWLDGHRPPERGVALIHNDYKYDNLVLDLGDPARILAVLDWEMATVGDPLMDLGTTLGYWLDPDDPSEARLLALGSSLLPGNLTRAEVVERYARASGRDVGEPLFYYVYGLFKIAVIAQQIYARWKHGATTDQRFSAFRMAVQILGRLAVRAIELGRIDRLG